MQIHFDQMNTIAKHLDSIAKDRIIPSDPFADPTNATIHNAANTQHFAGETKLDTPVFTPNSDSIPVPYFLPPEPPDPKPAELIPEDQLAQSFTKK